MSEILKLVIAAKENDADPLKEICFGIIPNYQAMSIIVSCKIDLRGCRKMINIYGINHALKRHGNNIEESKNNQIGLVDSDFELIPIIISDSDFIERGTDTARGNPVLKFYKKIDAKNYILVMTYFRGGRKGAKLEFDTMYIKK